LENWSIFQGFTTWASFVENCRGGLLFDASAIFYTNSLWLVLMLLPLRWLQKPSAQAFLKWLFVVVNAFCVVINLMDSVYFPFTQQRTTAFVFDEFQNEGNLLTIFGVEVVRHWYLVLLAAVLIYALFKGYRKSEGATSQKATAFYLTQTFSLLLFVPIAVCGMRGASLFNSTRPIAISNAHQFAATPLQSGLVLNTPFAILRTLNEKPMQVPTFFETQAELDSIYTPVHIPDSNRIERRKNVVILIVESFAQEFVGALNHHLDNGTYRGYTPFADSLLVKSLTWQETISNSGFSIDAMPAGLASIPRMDKPFVLTPFSLNTLNSIASELGRWGYSSAFFHGAPNGSMGFQAFARSIGFDNYYGMTEYCQDKRFGGNDDFDGTWAIWDEPFLQYYCTKMSEMHEPFVTTVFTASSHHPFHLPEAYRDTFPEEGKFPLHKCIRYTDHSLRRFFESASHQPWFKNTIFVLTADHASSRITHDEYMTEVGLFRIPILFYDPSGEMPRGTMPGIAQQIDIMPTLLGYLGYDRPYIAFGIDLLSTPPEQTWAFNWDHVPQYLQGDYVLHFDGEHAKAFYDYRHDRLMKQNLHGKCDEEPIMERRIKALVQSFMQRMKNNDMTITNE
jgi:phosphoglycerol transferase MdoB-like AlkP superfamily enzyme